jgi:tetratricopeptide (TPR) repeat protein
MKRILYILTAILITATAMLLSQSQLEKAKELLIQKKSAGAIAVCQSYLQSSPRDENGWLILAKAHQQAGDLNAAENAAKKSLDLDDELMEGYTVLTQIQLAKKRWNDACITARSGLKLTPKGQSKYPPLLIELARSLLAADSADAAIIVASEAREIDPKNPVAYEIIGLAYLRQNQSLMAVNNFEKSLEIDPQQIGVLFGLADAYTKGRQYTEAAQTYIKILEKDSTNDTARLELALLLFRAKQYAKCVKVLEEYFDTHKNPPKEIRKMYIEALLRSGQYEKAYLEAQEIIKLEPNSALAYRVYANYYFYKKQYAQSVDAFNKLTVIDTLEFDDYRLFGFAYNNVKKDSLAAKVWEEIIKDTTQSIATRSYFLGEIGSAWMRIKMYDKALDAFNRRFKLDPSSTAALINKAFCYEQMEKYNDAIDLLKEAKQKTPNYPPIYSHLGYCYFQIKLYGEGRKEYEMVIQVVDTAVIKYRYELADANRMIGLSIMLRKETDPELSKKKWEEALVYLKKSLKYVENFGQTHFLIGKCYQNLSKIKEAVQSYKRALKLDPTNNEARKLIEDLEKFL